MNRTQLFRLLLSAFEYEATKDQQTVLSHLAAFLLSEKENPTYLLKGYAGTGKTSLVASLVKTLPQINMRYVLLAPTGRAAKVLANYTQKPASTIHRKLYRHTTSTDGSLKVSRMPNKHKNTVFIIDEVSMISDAMSENNYTTYDSLLNDLISYVFSGENCRLLLIGDNAQLPPVGLSESPALDIKTLKNAFVLTAASFEMTEVMRQAGTSGILCNATKLRTILKETLSENTFHFSLDNFSDISKVTSDTFEDLLHQAFGNRDITESVIICRSNKRANAFNQAIRSRILFKEEVVESGDLLMVVKNNYFWLETDDDSSGFIANGDIIELLKINRIEELYGFQFADAEIRLVDYSDEKQLSVKIILDTLTSETAALSESDNRRLFGAIEEDYSDIPNKRKRYEKIKTNPYFNALQVKFAYALTCHKTQGGQWSKVFVDGGMNPELFTNQASIRWLYTALTRATENVYLVNFPDSCFAQNTPQADSF
ncbi:MAG: AAA family ATPase [Lentimicrobiaceae bacterium]|jgi:ATP-dependent exoDNAse (exonuclease V) alpha subunit|nr:AAA family ATPase [Lentimicrobiaceae bacterium]